MIQEESLLCDSSLCFLNRNPGLGTIAELDNTIVGAILCGHDLF